jgi:microcystin-dependent protein
MDKQNLFSRKNLMIGGSALAILIVIGLIVYMVRKREGYTYATINGHGVTTRTNGQLYASTNGMDVYSNPTNGIDNPYDFSTTPFVGTSSSPANLALVADMDGNLQTTAAVPLGAIIMWCGKSSNVPTGWALCNGQTVNLNLPNGSSVSCKTPDLTGRFVVGTGISDTTSSLSTANGQVISEEHPFGKYDGEEFHALSVTEMPPHNHLVNNTLGSGGSGNFGGGGSYTLVGETSGSTGGYQGNVIPHNNMPPFYALAYIIKYM